MQLRHGLVIGIAAFAGLLFCGGAAHAQDPCRVDQVLSPGQRCTVDVPGGAVGGNVFEVTSDGRGCFGSICSGGSININGFRASRIEGTSNWRIDALPTPVPVLPPAGQVLLALLLGGACLVHRLRLLRRQA